MPHSGRLHGRSFNSAHQARRQAQGSHEQYKSSKFTGVPNFSNADGSRIDITGSTVNSSRGKAVATVALGMLVFSTAASLVSASTGSKSSSGSKPSSSGDGNKGSKPSSSAKGGIQKGGVQFDDFQAGNKVSESVSPAKGVIVSEGFSHAKGAQGFEGENFDESLDKVKAAQRYSKSKTIEEWTVDASYSMAKKQDDVKCDYTRRLFGSSMHDYKKGESNIVDTVKDFFKYLPRSLPVLQYYNSDFPARSAVYTYALSDGALGILENRAAGTTGFTEAMEESFKSRDENGRSIFDILCVVDPKGDLTLKAFRPDTIKHNDKAGVPSLFYALMASELRFTNVLLSFEGKDGSDEFLSMIHRQCNEYKDLLDNPDETLDGIASSLHRDVNEAYNAHDVYFSGSYSRMLQGDSQAHYTFPFPCACESLVSSSGFQACTKDYVDLVADMKKSGILFRKSVKLPDGGERSFKKVGSYTAVSPGPEDETPYEVPVITKANAKAISDYFKSNRKALDKWMDIKERIKDDFIAMRKGGEKDKGHKGSAFKPDHASFLKYLEDEHKALSEKSILEGLSENFSKNLAILRKAFASAVKKGGVYVDANNYANSSANI